MLWRLLYNEKKKKRRNNDYEPIATHGLLNTRPYVLHFRGQFLEAKWFFFDRKQTK